MIRTNLVAAVLFGLALTACTPETGEAGNPSTTERAQTTEPGDPAVESTDSPAPRAPDPTSAVTAGVGVATTEAAFALPTTWEPGSVSCSELEDNFPDGVDDLTVGPFAEGILTFYWTDAEGVNQQETLQFLDDPSCTSDSDAWRFAIGHFFGEPDRLYASGHLCGFWADLTAFDSLPANYETMAEVLAPAVDLCS